MSTYLVWILFSFSAHQYTDLTTLIIKEATHKVERFATLEECERVKAVLQQDRQSRSLRCVQANIVK